MMNVSVKNVKRHVSYGKSLVVNPVGSVEVVAEVVVVVHMLDMEMIIGIGIMAVAVVDMGMVASGRIKHPVDMILRNVPVDTVDDTTMKRPLQVLCHHLQQHQLLLLYPMMSHPKKVKGKRRRRKQRRPPKEEVVPLIYFRLTIQRLRYRRLLLRLEQLTMTLTHFNQRYQAMLDRQMYPPWTTHLVDRLILFLPLQLPLRRCNLTPLVAHPQLSLLHNQHHNLMHLLVLEIVSWVVVTIII